MGSAPEDKLKVYWQPDENINMVYPCITYNWDFTDVAYADNIPYALRRRYMLTVITDDPDSPIPSRIEKLPMCSFNRAYPAENLHHFVFNLFF